MFELGILAEPLRVTAGWGEGGGPPKGDISPPIGGRAPVELVATFWPGP